MSRPVLLVEDARWPLDADGRRIASELEAASGEPVTALRVPTDAPYALVDDRTADLVVVVAKPGAAVVPPPSNWTAPVCWHGSGGCADSWTIVKNGACESITEFVGLARQPETAGTTAASSRAPLLAVLAVLAVALLLFLVVRIRSAGGRQVDRQPVRTAARRA